MSKLAHTETFKMRFNGVLTSDQAETKHLNNISRIVFKNVMNQDANGDATGLVFSLKSSLCRGQVCANFMGGGINPNNHYEFHFPTPVDVSNTVSFTLVPIRIPDTAPTNMYVNLQVEFWYD